MAIASRATLSAILLFVGGTAAAALSERFELPTEAVWAVLIGSYLGAGLVAGWPFHGLRRRVRFRVGRKPTLYVPTIVPNKESDYPHIVELSWAGRPVQVMIESARYGCGERWVNVPDVVSRHITNDEIRLVVSSETFGVDPCPGRPKELEVKYSVARGPVLTRRLSDHETLVLPQEQFVPPAGRPTAT